MEFKGTKGKWKYAYNMVSTDSECVAVVYGFDIKEKKANGTLIENAKDLLQMVEMLAENLELQLSMRGCCMHGDDKDRKADADSYGGNDLLKLARELIIKTTNI